MNKGQRFFLLLMAMIFFPGFNVYAGNTEHPNDTHYTASGFFDIHLCNWPDRPPFYMALYSTKQFKSVRSIELANAAGRKFAALDLSKFRVINAGKKSEKRVFINQVKQPEGFDDGWFSAKITMNNGDVYLAKDLVEHGLMAIAANFNPAHRQQINQVPKILSWPAIKGATYYQVFIKDKWDEDKQILSSKLLSKPQLVLPKNLLENGGFYSWRVHARDVNGDVKLGDFNLGSLSSWQEFTIAD